MEGYLADKVGQKIGVLRDAVSKEAYFEAVLKELSGKVAVFEDEDGHKFAVPVGSILMVGEPESFAEIRGKVGFV